VLGTLLIYSGALARMRPLPRLGLGRRRRGVTIATVGLLAVLAGAVLPARLEKVTTPVSRLDAIVPAWQFGERHEILVHAPPARVDASMRQVSAREITGFRLLTWLRNPRRPWAQAPTSLLAPPADRPILAVALDTDFLLLAAAPGEEVVFGTLVLVPPELRRLPVAARRRLRDHLTPA